MTQAHQQLNASFYGLCIAPKILEVLDHMQFTIPTPIQHKTIPIAIEGKDIIGVAQTGTGKTLAFAIPVIQRLAQGKGKCLVLVPTRELAIQIDEAFQKIAPYEAYGLEISDYAIQFCRLRKIDNIVRGSVYSSPFKKEFFDIIVCLDVLYHRGIENDVQALRELHRLLQKDGILILNIPAYDFLKSQHDTAIHTRHRYVAGQIRRKVEEAGFRVEKITYRNTILFPLAPLIRMAKKILPKNKNKPESDLSALPAPINGLLKKVLLPENRLIRRLNFPFGLSIFCVAVKN